MGRGGGGGGHGGGGGGMRIPRGGPRGPFIGGRGGWGAGYYPYGPLYVVDDACEPAVQAACAAQFPSDPAGRAGCVAAGYARCSPTMGFDYSTATTGQKVAAGAAIVTLLGLAYLVLR